MSTALPDQPAPGASAAQPENSVRGFSPLSWPRIGVDLPISLEYTGENAFIYGDSQRADLFYLRARYYDPATAQFLTVDPLVATTRSPYGYVAGNPLNGTDPTGMFLGISCDTCGHIVNAVTDTAGSVAGGAHDAAASASPFLHFISGVAGRVSAVSGVAAGACGGLAVVTSATILGGIGFGTCATVAGIVSLGSLGVATAADAGLVVGGQGSSKDVVLDGISWATWGLGTGVAGALDRLGAEGPAHMNELINGARSAPFLVPTFAGEAGGTETGVPTCR